MKKHIFAICLIVVLAISLGSTVIALGIHYNQGAGTITVEEGSATALSGSIRETLIVLKLCEEDASRVNYSIEKSLTSENYYVSLYLAKSGIYPDHISADLTEYEYWCDPIGNTKIVWNSKTGSIVKTDFNGDSVIQPAFRNQTDPAVGAPILNETGDTVISCYLRESLVLTGICQSDAPRMTSDKEPDLTDTGIFLPLSMAKEGIYPDRISPDMSEYEYWYDSDGTVRMIWNSNTGSAVRKDASGDSVLVAAFDWNAVDDPQGIILQAKPTSTFPRSMKSAPKTRITLEQFDHLMDICGIRSLHMTVFSMMRQGRRPSPMPWCVLPGSGI